MSSDLELVAERLSRLQRISGELNGATTVDDVTDIFMNVLDAPVHAPARGLYLYEPAAGELVLVANRGLPSEAVRAFARIPIDGPLPGATALRERRTIVSHSRTQAEAEFEGLKDAARSTEGFVAVPLLLEELQLGVLALGYDEALTDDDVAFLEAIAGQVAQTLVRVRLADKERQRRMELEFLAEVTVAALHATDYEELMHNVTTAAVPMLGDYCVLYYVPEGTLIPSIAVAHVDPAKVEWVKELQHKYPYDPSAPRGVAAVIRSGETEFLPGITQEVIDQAIAESDVDADELMAILEQLDLTSAITVALRTKRRIVGAMQFVSAESGRRYDEDDVALAEAVAGRLAEALDSAWLSEQHRQIAVTLQRALLPPRLPIIDGLDLAARYWPAGGAEVGGDFYDVFKVADDSWSVVIGDACGTGPNAAALTSIARHTVRAAARHGAPHTEVIDWLNEAILLSDRDLFCTACYSTLTRGPDGWTLCAAAAGHPLPIVARAGEAASVVGAPGTLLGIYEKVKTSPGEVRLQAGDVVVFYTDGVTDLPPPHGLDPNDVLSLVDSLRDRPTAASIAEGIRESVLERVPERSRQDDIAVVVLRVEA